MTSSTRVWRWRYYVYRADDAAPFDATAIITNWTFESECPFSTAKNKIKNDRKQVNKHKSRNRFVYIMFVVLRVYTDGPRQIGASSGENEKPRTETPAHPCNAIWTVLEIA